METARSHCESCLNRRRYLHVCTRKAALTLRSDSFDAPNPNDAIPVIPAHVEIPPISRSATPSQPQLPKTTVPIHVPNGEALDTPELAHAPQVPDGGAEEGEGSLDAMGRPIPTDELFVKDAFLVFRALCKLSMKPLVTEK